MTIKAYTTPYKDDLISLLHLNTPTYFHPDEEKDFINYLEVHAQDYFVVEQAQTIIGAGGINYFPKEKQARLSWDIIHPAFQGNGIGRELTQFRIELIRSKPAIDVIMVRTTQLVNKFYEKLGFELVKVEKDFWAQGFDLYQMEMRIR